MPKAFVIFERGSSKSRESCARLSYKSALLVDAVDFEVIGVFSYKKIYININK